MAGGRFVPSGGRLTASDPAVQAQRGTLAWASATHFVNDGLSAAVSLLLPFIAADLALSYGEAGLIKASLNGLISLVQLPAGFAAGYLGEPLLLALGLGWFSVSFLLVGLSSGFGLLLVLMASGGAGGGVYHPVGTSWVSRVFLGGHRGTAVGTLNFAGDLGKVAMPAIAGYLVLWVGWRGSLVALGASGVVLALALAVYAVRQVKRSREDSGIPVAGGKGWGVRRPGQFLTICLIGFIDQGSRTAVTAFLGFLLLSHGLAESALGWLLALTFAGGAFGKFGCGWLVDRMEDRRVMALTEAGMAAGCLVLALTDAGILIAPLLLVFGFALNGTSSVIYTRLADTLDPARFSRGYGLYYTLSFGSSALAPIVYGLLGDWHGIAAIFLTIAAVNICILPLLLLLRGTTGTAVPEAT